jgi:serine O-acetyltransferase
MTGTPEQGAPRAPDAWNLADIADGLSQARDDWRAGHRQGDRGQAGFPSRRRLELILTDLSGALFPLRLGPSSVQPETEGAYVVQTLARALAALREQVQLEIASRSADGDAAAIVEASRIVAAFAHGLPAIRRLLDTDVDAAYAGDPAARSVDEVLICYPGIQAVIPYRLAHSLYRLGAPLIARVLAEIAHSLTGIDIHPGASIGHSFFIDHGNGVVIGETAVVGDRVRIYQAVTLGARSFPSEKDGTLTKGVARHPIVEDDVVIYAGATILGRVTVGAGAVIGGNVWLTESVPPGSVIHQAFAERARAGTSALPTGHVVEEADPEAPRGLI